MINLNKGTLSIDEEIQVGYVFLAEKIDLDDTLPMCRGHVFQDLNIAFEEGWMPVDDTLIEVKMHPMVPQRKEKIMVVCWDTFVSKCTTGSAVKNPMTRHDMRDTWTSVANLMVLGIQYCRLFY